MNGTAFYILNYIEKAERSRKNNQFLLKNLRIEYSTEKHCQKVFISSSIMMQDTYLSGL